MSDELKPCPFCGSTNVILHPYDNDTWGKIECKGCCSSGPPQSSVDTINTAWNRRAAPPTAAATDKDRLYKLASRFCGWRMPDHFLPDCYVTFDRKRAVKNRSWPAGTNLLTVDQAMEMLAYVLDDEALEGDAQKYRACIERMIEGKISASNADDFVSVAQSEHSDMLAELKKYREAHSATIASAKCQWRCFHCDELFTSLDDAQLHFGEKEHDTPLCQIKDYEKHLGRALREANRRIARYQNEDSDVLRAMYSLEASIGPNLQRAEEDGYTRGLKDGRELAVAGQSPAQS